MPRQVRIQYPNAVYHVLARGNRRGRIYTCEEDRELFLQTVSETCDRTGFEVFAWILMDNHYHLALRTPDANLVEGMTWLQNTYTCRFNARHKLWGRLFGDRYRSILVEDDRSNRSSKSSGPGYLPTLIDYIHLNPARARIIQSNRNESIEDYPWSSLSKGFRLPPNRRPNWLLVSEALESFGLADSVRDRRRYIEALDSQIAEEQADRCGLAEIKGQSLQSTLRRGWYWGSEAFHEKMLRALKRTGNRPTSRNYGSSAQESDQRIAEAMQIISKGATHFRIRPASLVSKLPRGDQRRAAIAWALWKTTSMPQHWIASQTSLRSATNVSRLVRVFDSTPTKSLSRDERAWKARFSIEEHR